MMTVSLDPESGQDPRGGPSPKRLVAALRKMMEHRASQNPESEPEPEKRKGELPPESGGDDAGASQKREATGTDPPVDWANETLAAFHKADGDVWDDRGDRHAQEQGPAEAASVESGTELPERPPAPLDTSVGAEDEAASGGPGGEAARLDALTDSSEDLALAFRQAFYRRRVRHKAGSRTASVSAPDRTAALPPRPASSFLWVTGNGQGRTTSVDVRSLNGRRARRAEAFLLWGDGEDPRRLLARIRRHAEPRIFLKPVFWRGRAEGASPVADHVDGTWTPRADRQALRELRERAATINRRIRDVIENEVAVGPDAKRLLRFVVTRTDEFAPRRGEAGIMYPKLAPLLGAREE